MKKLSFQISLRFMLLLVFAVAIGLASWFGFSHHLRVAHIYQTGNADLIRRHAYWSPNSVLNNKHAGSLFEKAIKSGNVEMVEAILAARPNLSDGTALALALKSSHPEVIQTLLRVGAKPNFDCLRTAIGSNVKLAEHFIAAGVSPYDDAEPLRLAIDILEYSENRYLNPVTDYDKQLAFFKKYFRSHVDTIDADGNTLLHYAAEHAYLDSVEWLLSKRADPNLRNSNGQTPLHKTCSRRWGGEFEVEIIDALLQGGADVNSKTNNGATPLHNLCARQLSLTHEVPVIEALVNAGANVNEKMNNGLTPLQLLCCRQSAKEMELDMIDVLMGAGANIGTKSDDGDSPIALHLLRQTYDDRSHAWCRLIPISRWPSLFIEGMIERGAEKCEPIDVLSHRNNQSVEIISHASPPAPTSRKHVEMPYTCFIYRNATDEISAVICEPLFPATMGSIRGLYQEKVLGTFSPDSNAQNGKTLSRKQLHEANIQLDFENRTATFKVGDKIAQANTDTFQFVTAPPADSADREDQANSEDSL